MKKYLNTEGSIWRKWDLHLHAPGTKLNNQFKGKWKEYFLELEQLDDISVLGITDYYCVEDYFKVKEHKEQGNLQNIDLILPNVELRLDIPTKKGKGVNYHVIFSPKVDKYIQGKFLNELNFRYGNRTYKANKQDFIELGRSYLESRDGSDSSDEAAFREGVNQFKVDLNDINDALEKNKEIFEGEYVTAVSNKSSDGASGVPEGQYDATKQQVYRSAMMIFNSNPRGREFFLKDDQRYNSPKPCVHGSDAHSLEQVCKPDLKRFTWIKADPTFEGLLQILYEPEERVRIQENSPETKIDYNIIEKVVFKSSSKFQERDIRFNPGLNTIIGGKSSGKSLLLYQIAKTIQPEEIQLREKNEIWKNPYKDTFIDDLDFEVHWRNGMITKANSLESDKGKVTYIPQLYINSLSEHKDNDVLQQKLKEILMKTPETAALLEKVEQSERDYLTYVTEKSLNLVNILSDLEELKDEKKEYQDIETYEKEKNKQEGILKEILENSKVSNEDNESLKNVKTEYQKIADAVELYKRSLVEVEFLIDRYNEAENYIENQFTMSENSINRDLKDIVQHSVKTIKEELRETRKKAQEIQESHSSIIKEKEERMTQYKEEVESIEEKYPKKEIIDGIKGNIKEQNKLIDSVQDLKKKISETEEEATLIKTSLIGKTKEVFDLQKETQAEINKMSEASINIMAEVKFNHEKFEDKFISNFNLRRNLQSIFDENLIDQERRFKFEENKYSDKLDKLLDIIITSIDTSYLKKGVGKYQLIIDTFQLYTHLTLDVRKENDLISEMSPGKKGLVLLELFLTQSDEKHPILIDQPEDNLDNRTISTELVQIIREKSKERQVILVTHNANLVVLTDSSNVIIANQDPAIIENETSRFEYITGALECSYQDRGDKLISKGIRDNACEILEGGPEAFGLREKKYGFL